MTNFSGHIPIVNQPMTLLNNTDESQYRVNKIDQARKNTDCMILFK